MSPRRAHAPLVKLLVAVFALCLCATAAAQGPRYTVTDLGPFTPRGVNEMGQVAGSATIDGRGHAVLYDGSLRIITPPGGVYATAEGINSRGQVTGTVLICDVVDGNCASTKSRAFMYRGGVFTILGTLGGRDSFAYDIDDGGRAVGFSYLPGPAPDISFEEQAFASGGGPLENIGAKMGVEDSKAFAASAVGLIAGLFRNGNDDGMFLYDTRDGTFSLIRPGRELWESPGLPSDVNDHGQIVGHYGGNDDGSGRAFVYDGGGRRDLGTLLPSHTFSRAWAIDNGGRIVGVSSQSWFTNVDERAFLYEGGRLLDLNALVPADSGWVLQEATDINSHGQIVGRGRLGGRERAFMLTPTEPVLLTEPNSAKALALDSVTLQRDPFPVAAARNFSADGRTRVTLFARNVELAPGEDARQLIVRAEGPRGQTIQLPVEHVGRAPRFPSLTQIVVRLTDGLSDGGDFQLSVTFRGATSNKASVSIRPAPAAATP